MSYLASNFSRAWRAAVLGGALLGTALVGGEASAEMWRYGNFAIDWADGYTRLPKSDINQYSGPNGVLVTFDVIGHHQLSEPEEKQAVQSWREYARNELSALALRHGAIVIPLQEEKLADDKILISLADQSESGTAQNFGLFFLVISPHGEVAQIVVEGHGAAAENMKRYRPFFDSARWGQSPP